MKRTTRDMLIGIAAMTIAAAAFGDPVVRPRPDHSEQGQSTNDRRTGGIVPAGKARFWVFVPNPADPSGSLPWMRDWLNHPHEEDAPAGDVDGPG